jgi:membrane protease YdiL (CAAX protease family)
MVAYFVTAQVVGLAYHAGRPGPPAELSSLDQIVVGTVLNALLPLVIPATMFGLARARWSDLGLGGGAVGHDLALGLTGALAVAPPCYLLMFLTSQLATPQEHPLKNMLESSRTGATAVLALAAAVVLAPAVEELLFRGILLPWLGRIFEPRPESPEPLARLDDSLDGSLAQVPYAWAWPNVVASALFAGLHAPQWPAPIPLFFLSLVLGWLALRTGRIWASIALHAGFNATSTALMLVLFLGAPPAPNAPPVPEPKLTPVPSPAVLEAGFLKVRNSQIISLGAVAKPN